MNTQKGTHFSLQSIFMRPSNEWPSVCEVKKCNWKKFCQNPHATYSRALLGVRRLTYEREQREAIALFQIKNVKIFVGSRGGNK